jgi:hypothetical protein
MVMLSTTGSSTGSGGSFNDNRSRAERWRGGLPQNEYVGRTYQGYVPATGGGFARTPTSGLRSPDAIEIASQGGVGVVQDRQEKAALERARLAMQGQQYVGIEDTSSFLDQGLLPFLGYNAKAGNSAQVYQMPEYTVDMVGPALQRMNDAELAEFRRRAVAAGLFEDNDMVPSAYGPTAQDYRAMEMLMSRANYTKATTWEQTLGELVENPGLNAPGSGSGSGVDYTGPMTDRSIIYQQTSIDAGRSILRNTMRELIGREPTDAEVRSYVAALNRRERSTPEITETVTDMVMNSQDQQTGRTSTTRVEQNAPVPTEVLRSQVEEGNAGEKFTFQAQDYFSRLMEVI